MPTILIAEDHATSLFMLTKRLAREGYDIVSARNGNEAVAAALSQRPDVILMDLTMPELDGWEATRQLKQHEDTRAIPVLALTARALVEDVLKARTVGFDGYETKPVDFRHLLATIATLLGNKAQES
jgi:two-component system cell cycle response regulator DivK